MNLATMILANMLLATEASTSANPATTIIGMIGYVVVIGGLMYFILIRPQRKQDQQHATLISGVEIGDSVLTTSGFYGTIIDIKDDMVIVEFGNNKNCRIPMQKAAIVEIEKPE